MSDLMEKLEEIRKEMIQGGIAKYVNCSHSFKGEDPRIRLEIRTAEARRLGGFLKDNFHNPYSFLETSIEQDVLVIKIIPADKTPEKIRVGLIFAANDLYHMTRNYLIRRK